MQPNTHTHGGGDATRWSIRAQCSPTHTHGGGDATKWSIRAQYSPTHWRPLSLDSRGSWQQLTAAATPPQQALCWRLALVRVSNHVSLHGLSSTLPRPPLAGRHGKTRQPASPPRQAIHHGRATVTAHARERHARHAGAAPVPPAPPAGPVCTAPLASLRRSVCGAALLLPSLTTPAQDPAPRRYRRARRGRARGLTAAGRPRSRKGAHRCRAGPGLYGRPPVPRGGGAAGGLSCCRPVNGRRGGGDAALLSPAAARSGGGRADRELLGCVCCEWRG